MACLECRRRRIKCDNVRPKCCHCIRLSKHCEYAVLERQKGSKKKSVKELENRLAMVEARLNGGSPLLSIEPSSITPDSINSDPSLFTDIWTQPLDAPELYATSTNALDFTTPFELQCQPDQGTLWPDSSNAVSKITQVNNELQTMLPDEADKFPSLQEIQDLTRLFNEVVYPCIPILHPERHNPDNTSVETQDPLCLRYAIWAHAAARSIQYGQRASGFYKNARMHLEHDEMQDDGLGLVSVAHVQACCLIAVYENDIGTPARAFMSSRRAIALSTMIGLHAQDFGESWATFKILKPAKDPIEAEERRRTFWYLFFADKWASASSGKSSAVKESEITTLLPNSESAFHNGWAESGQILQHAIENGSSKSACPLTIAVLSGCLLSEITAHLRQLQEDVKEQRCEMQKFWTRHQQLVNDTMRLIASIAEKTLSPTTDSFTLFLHMCLHGYLITLCQTAATFANEHSSSVEIGARLRYRARQAAEEIVKTTQYASTLDVRRLFPTTPSCLYLASSVFILDLKAGHNAEQARKRLQFLLNCIRQFSCIWKFSQLFLEQLLHNLEDCDIHLEVSQEDQSSVNGLKGMGRWSAMGPLFVADPALKTHQS